jgi:hypothetical protein
LALMPESAREDEIAEERDAVDALPRLIAEVAPEACEAPPDAVAAPCAPGALKLLVAVRPASLPAAWLPADPLPNECHAPSAMP